MKTYAPTNESKPLPGSLAELPTWEILNRIYRQDDVICLTWGTFNSESGRWEPNQDDLRTLGEWNYMLSVQPSVLSHEGGVWFCVNPLKDDGKRANHLVKDFRFCLLECDVPHADKRTTEELKAEKEKQFARFLESGLPIEVLYDSGGKSIHALVRIYAATAEQFKERVEKVYEYMAKMPGLDPGRKASAQLSRLPGATRGEHKQALLSWSVGPETFEEWEQNIPIDDGLPDIEESKQFLSVRMELDPFLIDGLLPEKSKLNFTSQSKGRKTWLQIHQALCIGSGKPWLGHECTRASVLYVNLELKDSTLNNRVLDICGAMGIDPVNGHDVDFWNLRGKSADIASMVERILARMSKRQYKMVYLDPAYKCLGWRDENAAGDITDFMNQVERISSEGGASICVTGHAPKGDMSKRNPNDLQSGSGVWARDPDVVASFLDCTDESITSVHGDDVITVQFSGMREDATPKPFAAKWDYPMFARLDGLVPDVKKGRQSKYRDQDIIDLMQGKALSKSELAKMASDETGMSRAVAYSIIKAMEKDGKLFKNSEDKLELDAKYCS
jgi:RecA-family ATPase